MAWLKWMLHQVRGEGVYGMLMSGDPGSFDEVMGQITQRAQSDPELTAELLGFVNAAYFDGWLAQYPPAKLRVAAAKLKSVVIAADNAAAPAKANDKHRRKNLSELAFTIITAMETGHVPARKPNMSLIRPEPDPPLAKFVRRNVKPEAIDLAMIEDAIARATASLEKLRPPDTDLGVRSYVAAGLVEGRADWILPQYFMSGQQALASWAMMESGESTQEPWMRKRISWLACMESISVYDRAIRLEALAKMPYKQWQPWIQRDVEWLTSSMTDLGGFTDKYAGGTNKGYGDNANSQYAVLGFWAAQEAGYDVNNNVWRKIDQYWRTAQFPPTADAGAGWATVSYKSLKAGDNANAFANRVACPMTAAGILSLSLSERYLNGPKLLGVNNKPSTELADGLKWLDKNFSLDAIDGDSDLYYYLWTIQNVGQASGYRTFNNIDWFRAATARLLNQQQADGQWRGPKRPIVSTSFALLYLSRARGPLAMCKVRFDSDAGANWNNRPNDMVNFVDYVSKQFEVPTSWQIADLNQPVYELAESATLYLTTDKPFTLKPEQVQRLREYILAGGLLIAAPEGSSTAGVLKSFRTLAADLFPGNEPQKVDAKHPFYSLFQKVNPAIYPLYSVSNGIRPMMVIIEKDISRDLQFDSAKNRESFDLLTNLYLYAAGQNSRRPRISTNYLTAAAGKISKTIKVARIKYDGNFDPEPMALPQLRAMLAGQNGIDLAITTCTPSELKDEKMAFITVGNSGSLKDDQAKALRKWIDAGGTLWIDTAGGTNVVAVGADTLLAQLGYTQTDLIYANELPMFTGKDLKNGYLLSTASYRQYNEGEKPRLLAVKQKDRPAIYITRGDITSGLAGINSWGIVGYSVPTVRKLVGNSILELKN